MVWATFSKGMFETLLMILASGKLRGEVRSDLALEKLARYVGVLDVSQIFHPLEQPAEQTLMSNKPALMA